FLLAAINAFEANKRLADRAVEQVPDEKLHLALDENTNSIAVIMKHVGGNLLSRWTDFLTSDGEKPGRNRDVEFELTADDTHQLLMRQWESGWTALFAALEPLNDADLERTVMIRGEPLTVLQAINRQLTHYSYHVGQIVYVAKHYAGNSWRSLSIPKGKSAKFNAAPAKYVEKA